MTLIEVAQKILREVENVDYGEGELKNGSLQLLNQAVIAETGRDILAEKEEEIRKALED